MNKFLLAGDKFMPQLHLKQPGTTCSACGPFTRNNERIDKACFQYDMAYGKSKDLAKRTQSDKVVKDKALKIVSDPKYDGYQRGLASKVYKFFDKKSSGSGVDAEPNYQLANELHRQIIKNFKRRKVYSSLETIFGVLI